MIEECTYICNSTTEFSPINDKKTADFLRKLFLSANNFFGP